MSSITISGSLFSLPGQTDQLTATARLSNGVTQSVTTLATWRSSNPGVATVSSTGVVTSAAVGAATITATYQAQSAMHNLTVSRGATGTAIVRAVYAIPQDRSYRPDYAAAIANALTDVQAWYLQQMAGTTFALFKRDPEVCSLPSPAAFYPGGTFTKVRIDIRQCLPVAIGTSTSWVVYADLEDACNDPGRLGVGAPGLTILGSHDLHGLVGEPVFDTCGTEFRFPVGRYIGGVGHELGHTFGLSHPPGCDAGLPSCDRGALMASGYSFYPNTFLREDDKQILRASPFFR